MLLPSIRRLALADVDEKVLRQLVEHGESLYVERKREPPEPPGLGAAAGSFANMLGGFVLLGIGDDGTLIGWEPPGRADLQSHLGALLREQVDPLPPYVAQMHVLDDKPIGVLRVFQSADAPHVVRGTGAIYVRSSKGNEPVPVDDHETVLAMARRGEEADRAARDRLATLPSAAEIFGTPDSGRRREYEGAEVIARAAPLTVTPAFRDWALTRDAAEKCIEAVDGLLPQWGMPYGRHGPELMTFGRATCAKVVQERGGGAVDESLVLVDSGGVAAAGLRRGAIGDDPPSLLINSILEDELQPLAEAVSGLLHGGEAIGRAIVDVWVLLGGDRIPMTGGSQILEGQFHVSREVTVPMDEDEVLDLARQWHREIQRAIGIPKFEGEPSSGSS